MALDLTCLAANQANASERRSVSVGCRRVTTCHAASSRHGHRVSAPAARQQQSASTHEPVATVCAGRPYADHHPAVLLVLRHPRQRIGCVSRRGQHLHEERADLLHQRPVDLPVDRDDRPERRHRITRERQPVHVHQIRGRRQPAGVGVLDDRHRRLGELAAAWPRQPPSPRCCCSSAPCPGAARTPASCRSNDRARPAGAGSRRSAAVGRVRPPG